MKKNFLSLVVESVFKLLRANFGHPVFEKMKQLSSYWEYSYLKLVKLK